MKFQVSEAVNVEESITIKIERVVHLSFYREFYKNYLERNKSRDNTILAGLFIHLTFESLVTYNIKVVVNMIYNYHKSHVKDFWYDVFEIAKLEKKFDFLQYELLANKKPAEIKKLKNFIGQKLAPLRNKIVHGHEVSETTTDNNKPIKSKLFELISVENIENLYNEFWQHLDIFLKLFNDIIIPDEIRLNPEFIKKDIIQNTITGLKNIEKEFNKKVI